MAIEFFAGIGVGVVVLLTFFRWLWGRNTDALIKSGPCAHCRRMLDVSENGADYEHWRVCPKHPARAEVERLTGLVDVEREAARIARTKAEHQHAENSRLRRALERYADAENWSPHTIRAWPWRDWWHADQDGFAPARAALAGDGAEGAACPGS